MDFNHCDQYNHLLTRKCTCGGQPEMLVDFVADFGARCTKCHLTTHAYITPERAAMHWNAGDDIMPNPLHIFWDDPAGYLKGEVVAIHIADDEFDPITKQSINFSEAIIEYANLKLYTKHYSSDIGYAVDIEEISSFYPEVYRHTIRPAGGETIKFENIVFSEDGRILRLEYRWNESWLFIIAEQHNLVISRDIVPYNEVSSSVDGEYPLTCL